MMTISLFPIYLFLILGSTIRSTLTQLTSILTEQIMDVVTVDSYYSSGHSVGCSFYYKRYHDEWFLTTSHSHTYDVDYYHSYQCMYVSPENRSLDDLPYVHESISLSLQTL